MKTEAFLGPVMLCASARRDAADTHAQVAAGLSRPRPWLARIGWGFDASLPLRPWPWAQHERTRGAHHHLTIVWFGFYAGLSWSAPEVPRAR